MVLFLPSGDAVVARLKARVALLTGADVAMMASALLTHGPSHVTQLERALLQWLDEREYASVSQMKGSVSRGCYDDPAAFERANYVRTLRSWSKPEA